MSDSWRSRAMHNARITWALERRFDVLAWEQATHNGAPDIHEVELRILRAVVRDAARLRKSYAGGASRELT